MTAEEAIQVIESNRPRSGYVLLNEALDMSIAALKKGNHETSPQIKERKIMNQIPYEEREKIYTAAVNTFGEEKQMVVALEELSECQKEICKFLRGFGNAGNLAEEIADATIMLEQMRLVFGVNGLVCEKMDQKIMRLEDKLKGKP